MATDPLTSFAKKWGAPDQQSADPATETLRQVDLRRAQAGKNPLTESQTQRAIQAATTRQPTTPMPAKDPWAIWKNTTDDITELVKGIPQLPMALMNEFKAVTRPQTVKQIGDVANLPIIRLLPGAYIASGILPGGIPAGDLLTHPVSTALDALPMATSVAKANIGRALRTHSLPNAPAPLVTPGTYSAAQNAKDLLMSMTDPDAVSRLDRLGLQGAVAMGEGRRVLPSMLTEQALITPSGGRIAERAWRRQMASTPLGSRVLQFSQPVRNMMSMEKRIESNEITKVRDAEIFKQAMDMSERFNQQFGDLAPEKWDQLHTAIADPDAFGPGLINTPEEAIKFLDDDLRPYADEYLKLGTELGDITLGRPDYEFGREAFVKKYKDGNVYMDSEYRQLVASDDNLAFRRQRLSEANVLGRVSERLDKKFPGLRQSLDQPNGLELIQQQYGRKGLKVAEEFQGLQSLHAAYFDDTLDARAIPNYKEMRKSTLLGEKIIDTNVHDRLLTETRAVKKAVRGRQNLDVSIRPATQMRTGSRKFYERYKENLERAKQLDPQYRERFIQMKDVKVVDSQSAMLKRALYQSLKDELGADYRLLHYAVPGDPNYINYFGVSGELERQNIASLVTPAEKARLTQEIKQELAYMSKDGYEPAYIPGVMMEKAPNVDSTTVRRSYMQPDFAKRRSFDYAPMYPDMGVSIAYAYMQDYMARSAIPYMVDQIKKQAGINGKILDEMLIAEAQSFRGRKGLAPLSESEYRQYLNGMKMGKNARFVEFSPEEIFPMATKSPTTSVHEKVWLPREMRDVIVQSFDDSQSFFTHLFEPVTNTFRVSVLLFAPAWHWNNIMSNSLMTSLSNPRAWGKIAEQWQMMGGGKGMVETMKGTQGLDSGLEASVRGIGQEFTPRMVRAQFVGLTGAVENLAIDVSRRKGRMAMENNVARARTGWRILDEVQKSKGLDVTKSAFHKMTNGSLGLNSFFDDLFRRANFEAFADKYEAQLRAEVAAGGRTPPGGIEALAAERALKSMQDWLMDWTQLLPVERGILRSVFPFYSFMSHIMRAAVKFPFDHPVRVAVINAFTRAEIEDWESRYPPIFRRLLGMADVDEKDHWLGINVDSFNPFRDVGNLMTMGTLLSSTHPMIQTALQQVGVDPMSGGPEYAPHFIYDPVNAGGRSYDAGNPIINLAADLVPQSQAIARWMGLDSDFRQFAEENPAAANRAIASGLRIPIVYRDVDVNAEVAKDEIKRFNDLRLAAQDMDLQRVGRYDPQLAELLAASAAQDAAEEQAIQQAPPAELAKRIVKGGGGPPANPLSAFVTV